MLLHLVCVIVLWLILVYCRAEQQPPNEVTFVSDDYAMCINSKKSNLIQISLMPKIIDNLLLERFEALPRVRVLDAANPADRLTMQTSICLFTHGQVEDFVKPGDHLWGVGVESLSDKLREVMSSLHIHEITGYLSQQHVGTGNGTVVGGDPLALVSFLPRDPNSIGQSCSRNISRCEYTMCALPHGHKENVFSKFKVRKRKPSSIGLKPSLAIHLDEMPISTLLRCEAALCTSPHCVIVAAAMGLPPEKIINVARNYLQFPLNDHLSSLLGRHSVSRLQSIEWFSRTVDLKYNAVKPSQVHDNVVRLRSSFPYHLFKPTLRTTYVFLDHGDVAYHGEVFYSVALLVVNKLRSRSSADDLRVVFLISESFGEKSGLRAFWSKYVSSHELPAVVRWVPMDDYYQAIVKRQGCGRDSTVAAHLHYDLRVIVTSTSSNKKFMTCTLPYANNTRHIFVIHRPQSPLQRPAALYWNNSYVASQSMANIRCIPPERLFTPSVMPIAPTPPDCSKRPVAIVQGGIATRRVVTELIWLLKHTPTINITIRILSRQDLPSVLPADDDRIDFRKQLTMTEFHEAFLGAAFIMPLIFPGVNATESYLQGHPTSSVAYGLHFRLRFIGHHIVHTAYAAEMKGRLNYWHKGTVTEFISCVTTALADLKKWCAHTQGLESTWPTYNA